MTLGNVYERLIHRATLSSGRGGCSSWKFLCSQPRQPYYQFQSKMDPVLSLVIHDILPTEILQMIFVEHAILEWKAPTIDGRVCRLWRQIILNTPRAWAYLTIRKYYAPSVGELRLWLHRSSTAPLHIDTREAGRDACQKLFDLFSGHHTRIASLRMQDGSQSFFEGRDFPCMQLLDVGDWYPIRWSSMPKLQSLRLCDNHLRMVPLSELPPLKMLALSRVKCTPPLRHSQSLTTLMLSHVILVDVILGPVTFPSLTYLSLFGVRGLKHHVNAPRLVTYHESRVPAGDSFNAPLPSLAEYGVYHPHASTADLATWHLSFPNIQRLAIRADERVILSIFTSLADQPHLLPALQTISAGNIHGVSYGIEDRVKGRMESLVLARNEARNGNVMLCCERIAPFQVPIFFEPCK